MKSVWKIMKIVLIVIIVAWLVIFVVDYFRAKNEKHPMICFSEKTQNVNGNTYYYCVSFGYKYFEYYEPDKITYGFGAAFLKNKVDKIIEDKK